MESFVEQPDAEHTRSSVTTGEGGGIFPGRLPFIVRRGRRQSALLLSGIRAETRVGFGARANRCGERVTGVSEELSLAGTVGGTGQVTWTAHGLPPDGLPDPNHQVLGGVRPAFHSHDVLELAGKFGPLPARAAGAEVRREDARPVRGELPVEVVLDLGQHLFAANL
jgi:hypothetical protein